MAGALQPLLNIVLRCHACHVVARVLVLGARGEVTASSLVVIVHRREDLRIVVLCLVVELEVSRRWQVRPRRSHLVQRRI